MKTILIILVAALYSCLSNASTGPLIANPDPVGASIFDYFGDYESIYLHCLKRTANGTCETATFATATANRNHTVINSKIAINVAEAEANLSVFAKHLRKATTPLFPLTAGALESPDLDPRFTPTIVIIMIVPAIFAADIASAPLVMPIRTAILQHRMKKLLTDLLFGQGFEPTKLNLSTLIFRIEHQLRKRGVSPKNEVL